MFAEIRNRNKTPVLYINGKKALPVLYGLSDFPGARSNTAQAQHNIASFAKKGIRLVTCDTGIHLGWNKTDPFDADPLIAEVLGVLEACPDAGIILRLHLNPPYWWLRDNPSETVLYRLPNGDIEGIDNGEPHRLIAKDFETQMRVSLASGTWINEAEKCLRCFCEKIQLSRASENLIGIQVACGAYGEWHQWGTDCGPAMRARFRDYLLEKYKTKDNLQKAWHDKKVNFENAVFSPETFAPADDGIFRDPAFSQRIIDSQQCIQQTAPRAILRFCSVIKESWQKPILTGAFYGYFINANGENCPINGHLMPELIFMAKDKIDFLCGPFPYLKNREINSVPLQRGLLESIRLNGFLWLTEMDQHPFGTERFVGGDPRMLSETIAQLRRNVFQPLLSGMGMWFYDHRIIPELIDPASKNCDAGSIWLKKGWWDTEILMNEIGSIYNVLKKYCLKEYQPVADVLFVHDTASMYLRSKNVMDEYALYDVFGRAGVAIDHIYLNDLKKSETARYRCIIFVDAYELSEKEREFIQELSYERQIVFLYAAGYSDEKKLSVDNICKTLGMNVEKATLFGYGTIQYSEISSYSVTLPNPTFRVCDKEAKNIAFYEDGTVAAAVKGNIWYFAVPYIDKTTVQEILRRAGVHIYCDYGDAVMAGAGIVFLHCFKNGERKIYLKNGKLICMSVSEQTALILNAETGEKLL